MASADLRFGLLGPVVAERDGRLLRLGGPKQRAVLAALAMQPGRAVSVDALVGAVWGDFAALGAAKTLQVYVANLRRVVEPARSPGAPPLVLVTREPGYVLDVAAEQVDASRFERSLAFGRELAQRDGHLDAVQALRDGLAEWRGQALGGLESLPMHTSAAARLEGLRLDALELCCAAELDLGLHDGLVPELEALVRDAPYRERLRALLIRALYASGRQRDALAAYQDARRTFAEDLGIEPGPELRELERRVLEQDPTLDVLPRAVVRARATVEHEPLVRKRVSVVAAVSHSTLDTRSVRAVVDEHGGTVIDLRGDAIVAAFGVPRLGVDDLDRATALAGALQLHDMAAGVATGVVAAAGVAISGAPLSRAVELASQASRGTTSIDVATRELLGGRATVEPAGDGAFVLTGRRPASAWRDEDGPFVGRDDELQLLAAAWQTVASTDRPGLITLVGETGIGTSRLAVELAARVAAPIVRLSLDPTATPDELVERLASAAPGSVVLLEHAHRASRAASAAIARWAAAAPGNPVLCIATATPELQRVAPSWPGPMPLALVLDVAPLDEDAARRLAAHVLGDEVVGDRAVRIAAMAGGNPLLVSELAQLTGLTDEPAPHRLEALFAARVDGLAPEARRALEAIAVLGGEASVDELDRVATGAPSALAELVTARLVTVDDDGGVVTHAAVVDVVASAMTDDRAVALHERAAAVAPSLTARAAHLERAAHRIAVEDPAAGAAASRAIDALAELAWRAWSRSDTESAIDAAHRVIALAGVVGGEVVSALRGARRRLAAGAVAGRLGPWPVDTKSTPAIGAWDIERPVERELVDAARSLAAETPSAALRDACDAVADVLSRADGAAQGKSASSSV